MLSLLCAVSGFFTNGAIVGMYAIFAHAFPTARARDRYRLRHRHRPRRLGALADHRGLPVQGGRLGPDRGDVPGVRFARSPRSSSASCGCARTIRAR